METIDIYLKSVREIPLLSKSQELDLFKRYQEGDDRAFQKLIEHNQGLVLKQALYFSRRSRVDVMDLIQQGNLGLIKAIQRFDPERGCRLSTYATTWVRKYCRELAFKRDSLVLVEEPGVDEPSPTATPEEHMEREQNQEDNADFLYEILDDLDVKERLIIEERFAQGRTYMEISQELGWSPEWIRQKEQEIRDHIRVEHGEPDLID